MSYYLPQEMQAVLNDSPQFRDRLYCRGFLLTNEKQDYTAEYPFYSNWVERSIADGRYFLYTHKETYAYVYELDGCKFFLIGHAYDPYHMVTDENELLMRLAEAKQAGDSAFWEEESNLTGVFCVGYIEHDSVVYSTDCAGMQLVYHGTVNGKLFLTSHSKLVADLKGLEQPEYITKLVNNKYWHYWGTWLPGDLSPFAELKRMNPNCAGKYSETTKQITVSRYYPVREIKETSTPEAYQETIHELGRVMSNTMSCIAKKWPDKKVSISVTGGRDSMTAL